MAWQVPEWLSATALGSTGGQTLADGSAMERGIHLRWQLGRDLGFPPGGFDVYRRRHDQGQATCVSFENWNPDKDPKRVDLSGFSVAASGPMQRGKGCKAGPGLSLPGAQQLRITLPLPARSVTITLVKPGAGRAVAQGVCVRRGQRRVVAEAVLPVKIWSGTVELHADEIDAVVLEGSDLTICQICAVPVAAGLEDGWEGPLNGKMPIYLPITHPDWPGVHAHYPDDQAEADARLPTALSVAAKKRYRNGFRDELHDILYALVGARPQERYYIDEAGAATATTGVGVAPSALRLQGLQLLSLAAIDPNLARELGLYYCDTAPAGVWDYRVVGHWKHQRYPGTYVAFDSLRDGSTVDLPLEVDGLEFLSPRKAIAARLAWHGAPRAALHLPKGATGAPVWISLTSPVPAVTLELGSTDGVTVYAYRSNAPVAGSPVSAARGDQSVTLENAGGIDALMIMSAGHLSIFAIVARRAVGEIGDLNAVTFWHQVKAPVAVRVPAIAETIALPGRAQLLANGTVSENVNAAGLRWTQYLANGSSLPGTPVLFHVHRDNRGNGTSAGAARLPKIVNATRPTLVSTPATDAARVTTRPEGWPDKPMHYVDRDLGDGWFGYAVRGIDLFGRTGTWSAKSVVQLLDQVAPPPPIGVKATYIDPDDPWLTDNDRDRAAANGSGVRVQWEWPGSQSIQAPDASANGEFRVYYQDGRLNALTGMVTAVSYVDGAATSTVVTDQEWTGAADALTNEYVRIGEDYFLVSGNTAGAGFSMTVNNLSSPTVVPAAGRFTAAFSPGRDYRTNYGGATSWDERVHAEPVVWVKPIRGKVARVTSRGDGTLLVRATVAMRDADGVLTAGVLVCNGVPYQALSHSAGANVNVVIKPLAVPSATAPVIEPSVGESLVYYPGRRYSVYVSGVSLTPVDGEPNATGHIGVSSSDGRRYVADDALWSDGAHGSFGGRAGNEGSVSPACKIIATRRSDGTTPAAPAAPASSADPVYALPADYYGVARYTVSWSAVTGASAYAVYRCSTAALFDRDRDQRQRLVGAYAGMDFSTVDTGPFTDDEEFATWFASWKTDNSSSLDEATLVTSIVTLALDTANEVVTAWRAWSARFYPALTDADIQELADRAGNEYAFQRVNAAAVEATSYDDSFDGRGVGAFVYRVRSVDESGNIGAWSDAFQPVNLYDVTAPATPAISSIVAGENSVTLSWRANAEDDLQEYWLWRSEDAPLLDDVRHDYDGVTKTVLAAAAVSNTDSDLIGLTTYYYRLAAVDTNGNVSAPSAIVSTSANDTTRPESPAFERSEWVKWDSTDAELAYDAAETDGETYTTGVVLQWLAAESRAECIVERRMSGALTWEPLTEWQSADDPTDSSADAARRFTSSDQSADAAKSYDYRVRIRDAAGNTNRGFSSVTVAAVE